MTMGNQGGAAALPRLFPIEFIPGCNTPADVTRAQLQINVERDLPWLEIEPLKDRALVIVAGGPSLKDRWPEIKTHKDADILALNNSYAFLQDHGITPNYFMLLDARAENIEFLRCATPETSHYIAAQCHPDVFDSLDGYDTHLYLTVMPDTLELVSHIDKPKVQIAGTVGTVGIKALSLAYALGYRELHLYGYDSSYADDEHHAFRQTLNDHANTLEVYLNGKKYITTPTLAQQASEFCSLVSGMVRHYGFDIELHCNGLLPDVVAFSNKLGEIPLEERERAKYEAMWALDVYRKDAPGEGMVAEAIRELGLLPGDTVIDFGCGTGRASARLQSLGLQMKAIDFAANCLDVDVDVDFVHACLWELPDMQADWGYCTDVMEHIPSEKVQTVIEGIATRCRKGAFFNIATRPDSLGSRIGQKLHMTVMDAENWAILLRAYFEQVTFQAREGEATFICFH